ncbi:hypothetical protein U1Q18_012736 [Sarracenia purpurea var. burkii]
MKTRGRRSAERRKGKKKVPIPEPRPVHRHSAAARLLHYQWHSPRRALATAPPPARTVPSSFHTQSLVTDQPGPVRRKVAGKSQDPETHKLDPELESGGQTDKEIGMSRSRGTINGPDLGSGGATMRYAPRPLPTPTRPLGTTELSSQFAGADPDPTTGRNRVQQSVHKSQPRPDLWEPKLASCKLGSILAGESGRTND